VNLALTTAAFVWLAAVIGSPIALAHNRMHVLAFATYEIGSRICHQRPERSFHLNAVKMPVCARCFGLYLSGALGLAVATIGRRGLTGTAAKVGVVAAALPIAVTIIAELLGAGTPSNAARMLTGLPLGLVAGMAIVGSLRDGKGEGRREKGSALTL
jgi:uncharacterized membrane protein